MLEKKNEIISIVTVVEVSKATHNEVFPMQSIILKTLSKT